MNPGEGRGPGRGLLVAVAVAGLFILFAAAAVDRGTPSSPSPTGSAEIGSAEPAVPAAPQDPAPRRALPPAPPVDDGGGAGSAELLIFLQPGTAPAAYAQEHGLVHLYTLRSDPSAHVFAAADGRNARGHLGRSKTDLRVRRSYLNERLQRVHCAWAPLDPYYTNGSPAGFPGQWHLGNGAVPGVNIKVPLAWARDVTGTGVLIGIVDDGLEIDHPDLQSNYVAGDSHDFGGVGDGDPSPVNGGNKEDRHGTSVAGVAAARGGNGIGGTGAAPLAGLAGLRIDFNNQTTAMFVDATKYHSDTVGAAIKVKNHSYGYSVPYIESEAERTAVRDSANPLWQDPLLTGTTGTIHLFAAGNERGGSGEDSNKQDVQSSPDVIAVAAFGSDAKFATYSSFGANVFVTTPSSTATGFGVTTTDRVGTNGYNRRTNSSDGDSFPNLDYTSEFGGTSSATPLAAGVMALVKQVQPNLNVRFAKHLLVRTSQICDPNDNTATGGGDETTAGSAWKTNGAGFKFNQNYGFGLIDADALTQLALLYTGVTPLETISFPTTSVATAIPDNNPTGITQTFSFPSPPATPLEEVLVTINVTHQFRGDVEILLTSPANTVSRLAYRSSSDSGTSINWTFVSNAFWGESAAGNWKLTVRDVIGQLTGTWNSFSATARMGQLIVNPTPPVVSSIVRAGSDPTNAASVNYTVMFSKAVTGVDASDFALTATGSVAGASVTNVSGNGVLYTVTVNTGTGNGTLRLDLVDNDSIQDQVGNKLGGTGVGNGTFTTGEAYTLDKTPPGVLQVRSTTANGFYPQTAGINITVDFSELVTLTGGNLQVTLSTGDVITFIGPFGPTASVGATYTVGPGDNSPDLNSNSPLTLTGGTLRDAAGNNCVLTIPAGQSLADLKDLVVDSTAPQVLRVRSTAPNGLYGLGAAINVTVDFTEAVTLAGGNLQVPLSTGDIVTILPFVNSTSASGTYTVGAGDTSADLDSPGPLSLTGGTLRDTAGNNCVLTIPAGQSLAFQNNLVIDATAPTVTIVQAGADPTSTSPIQFTVTFSEPVTGFTTGEVTLSGSAGATTATVNGSGTTYTVAVSGMTSNGTVIASIPAGVAADAAGNANTASGVSDNSVTYDTVAPSATIVQAAGQADPTSASPILFTVTFSENVQNFQTGDVTLSGTAGATTAIVSGGPMIYTVTVSGMTTQGTVIASIGAAVANDPAGNDTLAATSTDNQVTYDATRPTVTIDQASGQSDPANAGPILFTIVFSEPVTGFATGDVTLGGTAGATTAIVSGTGTTYTVSVSGMTGNGTVIASIGQNVAIDGLGNLNFASTSGDNTVTFNPSVPTVTINQAAGQADPTDVASIVFDVVFSEAVNGFATGDVAFTGSSAGGTLAGAVSGSGTTYTVTVTGMTSPGLVVVTIPAGVATSVANGTGNATSTSVDNTVTFDNAVPSVTINQAGGQLDPTNVASVQFAVTFSESVTGFAANDLSFTGSTVGGTLAAAVSGSGADYTVTVTGMTGTGNVVVSIPAGAAVDALNHQSLASTSADNIVLYDGVAPTVTINQAGGQSDPANGASIVFTVAFSESVNNFATGDVSFTGSTVGGTLVGAVAGSGAGYTVTVTGMTGTGNVVVSIPANRANDPAGNVNVPSTSADNVVAYDGVVPTVTINKAAGQADPTNVASVQYTVTFSEAVTGFAGTDLSFAGSTVGGTLAAAVSGSGASYTVTVTGMTGTGNVVASIPANRASDPAGNDNVASTSTDNVVAYDGVAPTVTLNQDAGQADPSNGSPIAFTVVFSESVSNFATGDVTLAGTAGATTATVTGSGTTYTVTVTGMTASGTVIASLAGGVAGDSAGNPSAASTSTDNTVTVDITVPTVTVNQAAGQADPTNGSSILFTAVFSEAVSGFVSSDVTVGGAAGGVAVVSGGPTTYTITVSGMSGNGAVVVTIPAGAAQDTSGNDNLASTSADNTVTFDATAPVVSQLTSTTANGIYGSGGVIAISVLFSEPVVVTGIPQLTLETGAADAVVNFTGGSGSSVLLFVYTVAAGHVSTDLDALALSLNGGTIRDQAGNNATLTLPAPGGPGSLGAGKDLIVDTSPPVAGTVNDGWTAPDVDAQLSVTTLSANWTGFSDPESGVTGYEWAIGTTPGGQQILPFTPVELMTTASTSALDLALPLTPGSTFFVTVRATNGTGLTVTATSDGVTVNGPVTSVTPPGGLFAVGDNQAVLLDWLPSPSASVSFYRVWYKPSASTWSQAVRVDPLLGLSTVIPGLTNGTPYTFMIKAVDTSENESWGVYASATPQESITIGGLGTYGSPQAAIDNAVPGETVVLGPGTYSGALTLHAGISLQGSSPVHTIISGTILVEGTFPVDPKSTISNLTITGGTIGVFAGTADVLLDHVIIHHVSSHGASSAAGGRLRAVNCTVLSNGGDGLRALGPAEVRNCIVGKNLGAGLTLAAGALVTYSNVYGNGLSDLPAGIIGTGNLTAPALFLDEAANNFIEDATSSTVDTGDPVDAFSKELSPNGGRINQGAFGNTRWAGSKGTSPAPAAGRRKGGGGCGLTGLDGVALLALLSLLKRRRR